MLNAWALNWDKIFELLMDLSKRMFNSRIEQHG